MKYRADVDGLRAVAILAVLFFHAGIGMPGGYVGVDIFFVISGYLITRLIFKDLDRDRFSIVEFWERRVRRILPPLAVVILATAVGGWFLLTPFDYKDLAETILAQALLVSNIYFWKQSGYFARDAEQMPLLHTWSLAVEEQFYLFFPFLLLAVSRFCRRRLVPVIVGIGGFSFLLSVYCSYRHQQVNFYLLPTRAWELLIGALLAAIPALGGRRWVGEVVSAVGLVAMLVAIFFYGDNPRFPGLAAVLPCGGAALIIWANGQRLTWVGKLLALRPVVFIGLISYSLYLWHWPMLVLHRHWAFDAPSRRHRLLVILLSVLATIISWRFVERPVRERIIFKTRPRVFAFAGVTAAVFLATGIGIYMSDGVPQRLSVEAQRYAAAVKDRGFENEIDLEEAQRGELVELGNGDKSRPVNLVVWGDSHAMAAMPVFDQLCKDYSIRGVAVTHSSQAPLVGYESITRYSLGKESIPYGNTVVEFIRKNHVRDLVLVASWNGYINHDRNTARLREGLLATIAAMSECGTRLWIMRPVPVHEWIVPNMLVSAVLRGRDPDSLGLPLSEHIQMSQRLDPLFEGVTAPGLTVIDPLKIFLDKNEVCRVSRDGIALYWDSHHLTIHGSMLLRPLFEPVFQQITRTEQNSKDELGG